MKNLFFVLLIIGGVIGYRMSSNFKEELQVTLNSYTQKIDKQLFGTDDFQIKNEPFVCSGLFSYKCVSKDFKVIRTSNQEKILGLYDLTLEMSAINSISVISTISSIKPISAIRPDQIEVSLKASNIDLAFIDEELANEKDLRKFYSILKPHSLECNLKYKVIDKKIGKMQTETQCNITSDALSYSYSDSSTIKNKKFVDKSILKNVSKYYSDQFSPFFAQYIQDYNFAIDNVTLELDSKNFREFLYSIARTIFDEQQKSDSLFEDSQKTDEMFSVDLYDARMESLQKTALIQIAQAGVLGGPYQDALISFITGIKQMAINKASGVKISLVPRDEESTYFKIPADINKDIDPVVFKKILAKMYNDYDLKTTIIYDTVK